MAWYCYSDEDGGDPYDTYDECERDARAFVKDNRYPQFINKIVPFARVTPNDVPVIVTRVPEEV